jgi:hypothetical protein
MKSTWRGPWPGSSGASSSSLLQKWWTVPLGRTNTLAIGRCAASDVSAVEGYIRNQNPRLRTLPMAPDLLVDVVRGHDTENSCDGPAFLHNLNMLVSDVSLHTPTLYFTLTVAGGAVHHIKDTSIQPAC